MFEFDLWQNIAIVAKRFQNKNSMENEKYKYKYYVFLKLRLKKTQWLCLPTMKYEQNLEEQKTSRFAVGLLLSIKHGFFQ